MILAFLSMTAAIGLIAWGLYVGSVLGTVLAEVALILLAVEVLSMRRGNKLDYAMFALAIALLIASAAAVRPCCNEADQPRKNETIIYKNQP